MSIKSIKQIKSIKTVQHKTPKALVTDVSLILSICIEIFS